MDEKILLVTGKKAAEKVKKKSKESDLDTEIKVLPVSIASFMNLEMFIRNLEKLNPEEFSMVLAPGLAEIDLKKAEEKIGVPVFKGPKFAEDIPNVLNNFDRDKLSKKNPACENFEIAYEEDFEEKVSEKIKNLESESSNLKIGKKEKKIWAGEDIPPRIIGEIVDAPLLSEEEILQTANRFVENGAEILDIGMVAEDTYTEKLCKIIFLLDENFDVPLSIDTTDVKEIEVAIDEGIDLILSIDGSNIDNFEGLETPSVIIPRNEQGKLLDDKDQRVNYLLKLLEKARELDYSNPIIDPILNPFGRGFMESISCYQKLAQRKEELSMLMGIGNAIELFDADSIGMSGALVGMGYELGVDFILSVEASNKTSGNIGEVRISRDMMFLADENNSVPKDLGIDLLRFKEKRDRSLNFSEEIMEETEIVQGSKKEDMRMDNRGFFKIFVENEEIILFFNNFEGDDLVIKGNSADEILGEVLGRDILNEYGHAAYLGRELEKAEIALKTGKSYIQEEGLF